jgi:hypothetical protein
MKIFKNLDDILNIGTSYSIDLAYKSTDIYKIKTILNMYRFKSYYVKKILSIYSEFIGNEIAELTSNSDIFFFNISEDESESLSLQYNSDYLSNLHELEKDVQTNNDTFNELALILEMIENNINNLEKHLEKISIN